MVALASPVEPVAVTGHRPVSGSGRRTVLDRLTPVPLDDLVLHESVEPSRLHRVAQAVTRSGMLKNPILATPLSAGKWLVIDGAHRVSALRRIGADLALAQIFDHGEYEITAWHHMVSTGHIPGPIESLLVDRCLACESGPSAGVCLAVVELPGRARHAWCPSADVGEVVAVLRELTAGCAAAGRIRRVSPGDREPRQAAERCLRIAYRPWSFDRLRELADRDIVLPPGITRFVAPGRVLGANIPLSMLTRDCLASAEASTIKAHVQNLSLRYYAEPVFIGE